MFPIATKWGKEPTLAWTSLNSILSLSGDLLQWKQNSFILICILLRGLPWTEVIINLENCFLITLGDSSRGHCVGLIMQQIFWNISVHHGQAFISSTIVSSFLLSNYICFALLFWLIVKVQLIKEQCYECLSWLKNYAKWLVFFPMDLLALYQTCAHCLILLKVHSSIVCTV